jgi:translation initiation factor 4G
MSERKDSVSSAGSHQTKLKASAPEWTPVKSSTPAPVSAWGKSSDAVKAAAPIIDNTRPTVKKTTQHQQGQRGGRNGTRAGRGGRNRHSREHTHDDSVDDSQQTESFYKIELWKTGEGATDAAKQIRRISGPELLEMRLTCIDPPSHWKSIEEGNIPAWRWVDDLRRSEIKTKTEGPRIGGDAKSHRKRHQHKETAPPLEECAPLEKNEETRWKAKIMGAEGEEDTDEVVLKRALVCLNKLTLTKFDVVSDSFIDSGIGRNEKCLSEAISLIVSKAQAEPHFAGMYANLCLKLATTPMAATGDEDRSKKGKRFKKMLLERCQVEFQQDTNERITEATKDIEDEAEKEYHASIIRKDYLGHMTFIGELYKGDLLSIKIILLCLPELLKSDESNSTIDEEKVECFTKLMTTIGERLEHQSEYYKSAGKADSSLALEECWKKVNGIAFKKQGYPAVSTRLRFMLQDLIEMKDKGWETRRKVETAKTLSQIHKEAAREDAKVRRSGSSGNIRKSGSSSSKSGSSSNVRKLSRTTSTGGSVQVDADGFTTVPKKSTIPRSKSEGVHDVKSKSEPTLAPTVSKFAALVDIEEKQESSAPAIVSVPDKVPTEKDVEKSMQNILKEFFVACDPDDAVLSVKELIGENDGVVERTSAVLSGGCLLIMESKQDEVDKFISLVKRCFDEGVITKDRVLAGLQRPLDVVSDIAIDAPLATSHMAQVVAMCIKEVPLSFTFLLDTPEWFLTEGNAAMFGAKVLKLLGGDHLRSEDNISVVEKLMTDRDKEEFSSVIQLIASCH